MTTRRRWIHSPSLPRTLALLATLALAGLLWGCPLAHDDPQPTRCRSVADCFSGEVCDFSADPEKLVGVCRGRLDLGLEAGPDLPIPDQRLPDGPAGDIPDLGPAPDGDLGATDLPTGADLSDQGAAQ